MTTPTLESFTAQSLEEGFDEIIVREWAAHLQLDTHTHPFDVSAYVVSGEYWLTVGADLSVIFDTPIDERYERALSLLGLQSWMLSPDAGHA